jgi:hypothetical protein
MRTSKSAVQKGDIVEIHFLDHCQDGEKALDFVVWGRVNQVYENSIRVASWAHKEMDCKEHGGADNETTFTIVTSAISAINILHPAPASPRRAASRRRP